jgi:serine/threonine protein kinase
MEVAGAGERFLREARLASSLSHQNIVAVTDFGHDPGQGYFLVMELLEGETLRELMDRQTLGYRVACDIVDQLAGVMRYIHERGILHCDLKPDNLFLARAEGEVRRKHFLKLIDFGLSWRRDTIAETQVCGTPPYLAPERLQGAPPSPSCDVYALGMILYELIAGRSPFLGHPMEMLQQQLARAPIPPPSELAPERIDSSANALVLRALSYDPSTRHPSVEAFHYELRRLLEMSGMRSRQAPQRQVAQRADQDIVAALDRSPVPQAIVELDGTLRFASRAFLEATGNGPEAPSTIVELPGISREPQLTDALWLAAETRKPITRRLLTIGEGRLALVVAPVLRGAEVEALHLVLISS